MIIIIFFIVQAGNTKVGSCLTGLNKSVLQIKTKIVSCHTADSKPVKQEVNSTVILLPIVFPRSGHGLSCVPAVNSYTDA